MPVRLAIAGAGGRMGQALIEAALGDPAFTLAAALDIPGSSTQGSDAGERHGRVSGVRVGADVAHALVASDVLIDFTRPDGTMAHVIACVEAGVGAVIGTTGFDAGQKAALAEAATHIPVVLAPNMSIGLNVLLELVQLAARRLTGFDIEILEMHHRHKVDAPSGTALALGEAAAQGARVRLAEHAVYSREGVTGARPAGAIGFATLRGGDVVGEHTVLFSSSGERVEIAHKATSRTNFAAGALLAARFVAEQRAAGRAGLFDMRDVLGMNDG